MNYARQKVVDKLTEDGLPKLAKQVSSPKAWARYLTGDKLEFWASFRQSLSRPTPQPPDNLFSTPAGVSNLKTGEREDHDPLKHDTIAVSRGNFIPAIQEDDIDERVKVLMARIRQNISERDAWHIITYLGIALTRKSPTLMPTILWLIGGPGTGKGHVTNLIYHAFGSYAASTSLTTFTASPERNRREHDDAPRSRPAHHHV